MRFRLAVAPSLPRSYRDILEGLSILPPYTGPCAKAVHCGKTVSARDIATDMRWKGRWRAGAVAHGLRSCASSPIFASDGRTLGSFALYHHEPRDSYFADSNLIEVATHLAGIAIEHCSSPG